MVVVSLHFRFVVLSNDISQNLNRLKWMDIDEFQVKDHLAMLNTPRVSELL